MKKNGLRIVLALVIALACILGSISAVGAARGGHANTIDSPSISVSIDSVTAGAFYVSYTLGACPAAGYYINIRDDSSIDPHNKYVYCAYTPITSSEKGLSLSQIIPVEQANPGNAYTIMLYMAKNNGDIIEYAFGSWQPPL